MIDLTTSTTIELVNEYRRLADVVSGSEFDRQAILKELTKRSNQAVVVVGMANMTTDQIDALKVELGVPLNSAKV